MKKLLPILVIFSFIIFFYLLRQRFAPSQANTVIKKTPPQNFTHRINPEVVVESIQKPISKIKKNINTKDAQNNLPPQMVPADEFSVHLQDEEGNLIITSVTIVDDLIIAHGDLVVGKITNMDEFIKNADSGKPLIIKKPQLWNEGIIPYATSQLENSDEIEKAIKEINEKTNTKWVPRENEEDYVLFKEGPLNCYSPLGKIGGEQIISLSPNCKKGSIMHEMMHTMGILHEQNREDRDQYIKILWENIDSKNYLQFQKIGMNMVDLDNYPFDYKSLMLYRQDAFSKYEGDQTIIRIDGETYTPNSDFLSLEDIKKLNSLYPKNN